MSFTNVYYKRTAGTAKACFVCYRPTTTVLATVNTVDFIYTCPNHLGDHNFATRIVDEAPPRSSVSPEEIAKIKQEWEEKQKRKQEKEKEQAKEKEKEKEKDKGKEDKKKDGEESSKSKEGSKSPKPPGDLPASGSSTPSTPTHEKYALHRDFYAMRQLEHKKRRQAAQAKALAPRLPTAPRDTVLPSSEQKF